MRPRRWAAAKLHRLANRVDDTTSEEKIKKLAESIVEKATTIGWRMKPFSVYLDGPVYGADEIQRVVVDGMREFTRRHPPPQE